MKRIIFLLPVIALMTISCNSNQKGSTVKFIIEVPVYDILLNLSDYNESPTFRKALQMAAEAQSKDTNLLFLDIETVEKLRSGELEMKESETSFLDLFLQYFNELAPNEQLSPIFSTLELKDKISLSSTNAEIIRILQREINLTVDNSFNILASRIDRASYKKPNLYKHNQYLYIELHNVTDIDRARKLLQTRNNLEFWETYSYRELSSCLFEINKLLMSMNIVDNSTIKTEEYIAGLKADSLVKIVKEFNKYEYGDEYEDEVAAAAEAYAKYEKANPLFALLAGGQMENSPRLGMVAVKDTAKVMEYFNLRQAKHFLPRDLSLRWTENPESFASAEDNNDRYGLIALKVTNRDGRAPLNGTFITDAKSEHEKSQWGEFNTVTLKMNAEGAAIWSRLTEANIGKAIAISIDNYIYSYPYVNSRIDGGSSEISGLFTPEEAKDFAIMLKSGKMPIQVRIIKEEIIDLEPAEITNVN